VVAVLVAFLQAPSVRTDVATVSPRPILVTGAPRSGTTWVGNVLALDAKAASIHEPFNPRSPLGRCRAEFRRGFRYVTRESEGPNLEAFRDTVRWRYSLGAEIGDLRSARQAARGLRDALYFAGNRLRGVRPILKDPLGLASAEWMADRFEMQVVVVIRHPVAFVSSLRAAGWHRFPFITFAEQPEFVQARLAPYADAIAAAMANRPDAIDASALLWKLLHHHIRMLREDHPDWIFVRHEDLTRDPEAGFRTMFRQLGLDFSPEVERGLKRYTEGGSVLDRFSLFGTRRRTVGATARSVADVRKRMTPEEVARVREVTGEVAADFYDEADWARYL
jgi:hypothetical protein